MEGGGKARSAHQCESACTACGVEGGKSPKQGLPRKPDRLSPMYGVWHDTTCLRAQKRHAPHQVKHTLEPEPQGLAPLSLHEMHGTPLCSLQSATLCTLHPTPG